MTEDGGKFEVISRYGEVFTGGTEEEARARRRAAFKAEVEQLREADPDRVAQVEARLRAGKRRQRDVIDVRRPRRGARGAKPTKPQGEMPTAERAGHSDFEEQTVYEIMPGGRRSMIGRAWRVVPRFLKIEGLSASQLRALAIYRKAFDESERSEMKSPLDIGVGGRSGLTGAEVAIARLESIAFADVGLQRIEARIGSDLAVLRAVALFDRDFKEVAIEIFGGREVQWIDGRRRPAQVETVTAPKSGKHRTIVRDRFFVAVDQLVAALEPAPRPAAPAAGSAGEALPTTSALVPAAFLDDQGYMRPWDEIRAIIIGGSEPGDGDLRGGTD